MKRKTFQEYFERRKKWLSPEKAAIWGMQAILNPFGGQKRNPAIKPAIKPNPLLPGSFHPPKLS